MGNNIEFRTLRKGDEEGVSRLFDEVRNVKKDNDYWNWKYYQNPAGKHFMIVALHDGRIVGIIGSIPIKIKVGRTTCLSSQFVDIVVSPAHRKRGTFFKLASAGIELLEKNRVHFSYAFPNKETYRISTKFWRFSGVCPIFNMSKVINPTPYIMEKVQLESLSSILGFVGKESIKRLNKKRLRLPPGLRMVEVRHFDKRFDDFWYKEAANHEIAVVRDSEYLNWRYFESPIPYRVFSVEQNRLIKGFIVLRCCQEKVLRGLIIDILTEAGQEGIIDLLLAKAVDYFIDRKVDVVTCWMLEHTLTFRALQKRGFVRRKTPHDLIVRSYLADVPKEYLKDRFKWYITMGDSDYF